MSSVLVGERIEVQGVVQGVGFRPFVHTLATELGLRGLVGNDSTQVFIEMAGDPEAVEAFVQRLTEEPPPLARIDRVTRRPLDRPPAEPHFTIVDSIVDSAAAPSGARTLVPPDTATCDDCRRELFDPSDRRHRHPFITCTNCGPRFTIITAVPYDRPNTTMADFPLCPACAREYADPTDRRYHAQPIACHQCGPTVSFRPSQSPGQPPEAAQPDDPIGAAAAAIGAGAIVAVKGLGGYHLACDATNDDAVAELRARKHRADKPLAVMVADLAEARHLAVLTEPEATLLTSRAAPIVLAPATPTSPLSALVAPANPLVGVMVASTPLHLLLLEACGVPLVMTSANPAGEPLISSNDELDPVDHLFDAVLDHDRPICQPCDDSVVRVVGDRLLPIRRARGYAPIPVDLGPTTTSVLACGAELKNTFCLVADGRAWVSQHIGDMENLRTLEAFEASSNRFGALYGITPEVVAADAHPGYLSSRWARDWHPERLVEIQHHHAHVASVMAEHQLDPHEPILGLAFDGTGYGLDGAIWGGEALLTTADGAQRVGHLAPVPLPGGDAAIRQPARVALSHLRAAGIGWSDDLAPVRHLGPQDVGRLSQQLERNLHCTPTTSMGRLFDAVASLLGLRHEVSFEAQAAIDLEMAAQRAPARDQDRGRGPAGPYRFSIDDGVFDAAPVLAALVAEVAAGEPVEAMAWRFHQAVVDLIEHLAVDHRQQTGRATVALSGGVFQNALLTERCLHQLGHRGFRVLTHSIVPPNDGGLALGQAYIAAYQRRPDVETNEES